MTKARAVLIALFLIWSTLITLGVIQANVPSDLSAQPETTRVLVIANRNSPVSLRVAQYYMQRREIPTQNLLTLDLPDSSLPWESITYPMYQAQIERPLRNFLTRRALVNHIRYIVLTKGIPIRINAVPYPLAGGETFTQAQSIDSTLAALDYQITPIAFKDMDYKKLSGKEIFGRLTPNLYWRQTTPFEHRLSGGYLVTRLDGYSEADARSLVDRALTPRPRLSGSVLIDPIGANESSGEAQLVDIFAPTSCTPQIMPRCTPQPRAMMEAHGQDINNDLRLSMQLITTAFPKLHTELTPPHTFATGQNLIAYVSWGSNDESFRPNNYRNLQFLPGAIAETIVSTSARTFFPTWQGQSLIGDLVAAQGGVTGVRGYTDEPELQGIGSPTVLFSNYFRGANLATAYYRSIRFVGWRDVVLGDPLATAVFTP